MINKIKKTDEEWKAQLTDEQYQVARKSGTERAFTGKYHDYKGVGAYHCICCDAPLFNSNEKFDSGSGWPSFWQPKEGCQIEEITDASRGMKRVEVRCPACEAHLGHIFEDGPHPTGLRYCINSASLDFKKETE